MNCSDILKLLPEYTDQRLDDDKMKIVKSHLENCPTCRRELSETEKLLRFTEPAKVEAPEGYFDTIWHSLYSRIQAEGLNKPVTSIVDRLTDFLQSYRHRAFQLVNVTLILVVSILLYSSLKKDSVSPPATFFQKITESFSHYNGGEVAEKITKGQGVLADVMTMGLGSSEEPLEGLKNFINPEKQRQVYDSVTDYLAEMLIKLDSRNNGI